MFAYQNSTLFDVRMGYIFVKHKLNLDGITIELKVIMIKNIFRHEVNFLMSNSYTIKVDIKYPYRNNVMYEL